MWNTANGLWPVVALVVPMLSALHVRVYERERAGMSANRLDVPFSEKVGCNTCPRYRRLTVTGRPLTEVPSHIPSHASTPTLYTLP